MSKDDVRRALELFDDEEIRAQFESGEFAALGDHSLTAEEETIVSDAAADLPEVVGFALNAYLQVREAASSKHFPMGHKDAGALNFTVKLDTALKYAGFVQ